MRTIEGTTDKRIAGLVALLAENPMIVISGARIARQIGVSRHTVWRWMEKLRALGVQVKGHPATGYRIERVPDILVPPLLKKQLRGTIFLQHIHHFFKIDSTNTVALRAGQDGEPHGSVFLAEEQTAGRGRAGRSWFSEKGSGIHMTVLLRPAITPAQAPLLTLAAALAVHAAVEEQTGIQADIRWPNDLMLHGKKFCGILTEMHAEPDRVNFVVVGIGVNVNHRTMPDELEAIATSLRIETGRTLSRVEVAAKVLRHLERFYNQYLSEGAGPILRRFEEISSYVTGKRVRITTATETYTGTTAGIEPNGLLRVSREDGRTEVVTAGDVGEVH